MARVLTGIQSTGKPHLGNILGAVLPAIEMSNKQVDPALFFIADLHSVTTIKDALLRKEYTYSVAASWLSMGLDYKKNLLYRQSDVPEVCELAWYLSCFAPYPMLANAHSFKDKSDNLPNVNIGIFTYPILMASDILLYDADIVPVGKDQIQHLEITRDIAKSVNFYYGETLLKVPEISVSPNTMSVLGTDGRKMSKSYGNIIDIFAPEKDLNKQVRSIITDNTSLSEPKDPDNSLVYKIYQVIANDEQSMEMALKYRAGGYGHGQAKNELFGVIMDKLSENRKVYQELMSDKGLLDEILKIGAEKAREIGYKTLERVKQKII